MAGLGGLRCNLRGTACPHPFCILSVMCAVRVNDILSYLWFVYDPWIFTLVNSILEPPEMFFRDADSAVARMSFGITYEPEIK